MTELLTLSHSVEHIRKNWDKFSSKIAFDSRDFEILWGGMCSRTRISPDVEVEQLKRFIATPAEKELKFPNLNNAERAKLHELCDKIGLYHESSGVSRNRTLVITKPVVWLWDYTKPNRHRGFKLMYCNRCLIPGNKKTLLCSVHFNFIVCHTCCDTEMGEDGETLNCHKWERLC